MGDYSIEDKIAMIYKVIIDKESHNDVAKVYGLKTAAITKLISNQKKDKNLMTLLIEKQEEDLMNRKLI